MKLKFPKKITIGEIELKVKTDIKRAGGEFFYWSKNDKTGKIERGELIIGTKLLEVNQSKVLGTIIHELKEMIQEEQCVRFQKADEKDNFEFHYNHSQHTDFCSRLAGLLKEFIK